MPCLSRSEKMVSYCTHRYEHTSDQILRSPGVSIIDIFAGDCNLSDHWPVFCSTNIQKTIFRFSSMFFRTTIAFERFLKISSTMAT